jgi:hypothetical protein
MLLKGISSPGATVVSAREFVEISVDTPLEFRIARDPKVSIAAPLPARSGTSLE